VSRDIPDSKLITVWTNRSRCQAATEVDARQQQKSMSGSKRGRCPTVTEVDVRQQQKSVSGSNRNLCPAATEVARDFRPPL